MDRVAPNAVLGVSSRGRRQSTNDHGSAVGRVLDPLEGKRGHQQASGYQASLNSRRFAVQPDHVAPFAPQAGYVNKLDFESLARVMILDRDTEPGACGRQDARKEFFPRESHPLEPSNPPRRGRETRCG